jgi:hypothetical protein
MGIFTAESLALLARRQRPRKTDAIASIDSQAKERLPSKQPPPPIVSDPDDIIDPDDRSPKESVGEIYAFHALPPPSPNWSHILGSRPTEPASTLDARMVLASVGCRLSLHPSRDALCAAARCHDVAAVRSLLARVYGQRGLATAYQLAGREQPYSILKESCCTTSSPTALIQTSAAPLSCDAIEPGLAEALSQMPLKLQRWMLAPPRDPPRWRTDRPPQGMDDGAWCG